MKSAATAFVSVLILALAVPCDVCSQDSPSNLIPGFVKAHQKISDTEGGFLPPLSDGDRFGFSVIRIGDLDDDGVQDLAMGAPDDDDGGTNRGAVWVLFLHQNGTVKDAQKISDTVGDFTGVLDDTDEFGASVAALGDLDGDGVEDIAAGAPGNDGDGSFRGAVWVLFLNQDGTVKAHQEISETAGGFTGTLGDFEFFGASVAELGDLNGDGVSDIAVGAFQDDDGGTNRGALWLLFLDDDGTVKAHQKISSTQGGFTGTLDDDDLFGVDATRLGDMDGDGVEDIAVGALLDDDGGIDRGAVWILFLNEDGTVKTHQKISATSGGFTGTLDDGDFFGGAVSRLGDLDGDGFEDIAVGASEDDDGGTSSGAVWVLFLEAGGLVKFHQKISALAGGLNPLVLETGDLFGSDVAPLGDLDGDGIGDVAVGAAGDEDGGQNHGAAYILLLDGAPVLPVELVSFEAVVDGDDVLLAWQTATEENNAGFEVEQARGAAWSSDEFARPWTSVDFVEGHGTTTDPQSYTYRVASLAPGTHRFRLKQIDFDGSFEYSHELEVALELPGAFVLNGPYPNPFRSQTTLELTVAAEQHIEATLVNAAGRSVQTLYNGRIAPNKSQRLVVDAGDLPSGTYLVRLSGNTISASERVVLAR